MNHSTRAVDDAHAVLISAFARRLPRGLILRSATIIDRTQELHAEELGALKDCVEKRRHEFSTGRWVARQALAELGHGTACVPRGAQREPIWPAGIVGSITHSWPLCAVVVGRDTEYAGIGCDLEVSSVAMSEMQDIILSPREPAGYRSEETLMLIFSAKESVYKCLYPRYRVHLDFHALDIELHRANGTFLVACRHDEMDSASVSAGRGCFVRHGKGVATLFALPAE